MHAVKASVVATIVALAVGCGGGGGAHEVPPARSTTMKMQLDVKGSGRPLVLVGGGLTGWDSWKPHQERLAATRTVARAQPLAVQLGLENQKLPAGYSIDVESAALGAAVDEKLPPGPIDFTA